MARIPCYLGRNDRGKYAGVGSRLIELGKRGGEHNMEARCELILCTLNFAITAEGSQSLQSPGQTLFATAVLCDNYGIVDRIAPFARLTRVSTDFA